MLRKFELKNYKNFKDNICVDFGDTAGYQFSTDCITDGVISKMLIYGRNATGKTNLGKAFMNITTMLFGSQQYMTDGILLNADSAENSAENSADFSYTFYFGCEEVIYEYTRLSNQELEVKN